MILAKFRHYSVKESRPFGNGRKLKSFLNAIQYLHCVFPRDKMEMGGMIFDVGASNFYVLLCGESTERVFLRRQRLKM